MSLNPLQEDNSTPLFINPTQAKSHYLSKTISSGFNYIL
ncbi:MAG: hypothetical protein H6Q69_3146, partial [Firmicutes bacterium]|nr:hypothetical protein [Bacillota bacterium]